MNATDERAVQTAIDRLEAASSHRNNETYRAALTVGGLIAAGRAHEKVLEEIQRIAESKGLPAREAAAAIKSGLRSGLSAPLHPAHAAGPRIQQRRTPPATSEERARILGARRTWADACPDDVLVAAHPYSSRKNIEHAFGARRGEAYVSQLKRREDVLVVPVRELPSWRVVGVQLIAPDGTKESRGLLRTGCCPLGNTEDAKAELFVVEGWATGHAFLNAYPRCAVAIAFGAGRLDSVARLCDEHLAPRTITIAREAAS